MKGEIVMEFKERLKYWRMVRGFTQEELGVAIGTNKTAISRWEKGHVGIGVNSLHKLSQVLDIGVPELLGEEEQEGNRIVDYIRRMTERGYTVEFRPTDQEPHVIYKLVVMHSSNEGDERMWVKGCLINEGVEHTLLNALVMCETSIVNKMKEDLE